MKRKYVLAAAILTVIFSLCGCDRANNNSENKHEIISDLIISQISSEDISPVSSPEQSRALITSTSGTADSQISSESVSSSVTPEQSALSSQSDPVQETPAQNKILIAYFTWAENIETSSNVDATASASVSLPGNVGQMAAWIQTEIGGDLFSIQGNEPYSSDYDECLDRAADEKAKKARPKLKNKVENFAEYDIIFIGYPNWWYTAPMAVFSFLEEYDLSGKRVVLFCSHGTGGLASSVKDISAALPNSTVESNVIGVYRDDVPKSRDTVKSWLKEIGF